MELTNGMIEDGLFGAKLSPPRCPLYLHNFPGKPGKATCVSGRVPSWLPRTRSALTIVGRPRGPAAADRRPHSASSCHRAGTAGHRRAQQRRSQLSVSVISVGRMQAAPAPTSFPTALRLGLGVRTLDEVARDATLERRIRTLAESQAILRPLRDRLRAPRLSRC